MREIQFEYVNGATSLEVTFNSDLPKDACQINFRLCDYRLGVFIDCCMTREDFVRLKGQVHYEGE